MHPNEVHPRDSRFSPTSLEWGCPRYYYWNKIIGLEKKGGKVYLSMGTSIHAFIEEWQKAKIEGLREDELLAEATLRSLPIAIENLISFPGDPYSLENWMFTTSAYHHRWKSSPIIADEIEVINWLPMDNQTLFGGVMDMVYRKPTGIILRDTKTTSRKPTEWYWKGMENKFQLSAYFFMLSQLFPNENIIGVELDVVVIHKDPEKSPDLFQRRLFERSDIQIEEFKNTYREKTNWIMKGLSLPEELQPSYFFCETSQCGNYGGCSFLPICSHGTKTPAFHTDFEMKGKENDN